MGQYYKIINLDRKEFWYPLHGLKLMEFCYLGNPFCMAVEDLIATRWKGDRVILCGDYSDSYFARAKKKTPIETAVDKDIIAFFTSLGNEFGCENIYTLDDFKEMTPDTLNAVFPYKYAYNKKRYAYNKKRKEYIDLYEQLPSYVDISNEGKTLADTCGNISTSISKIDTFMLLISCGNGQEGGDYYGINSDKVGLWASTSQYVEFSQTKIDSYADKYTKLTIDFTEFSPVKSEIDCVNVILDDIKDKYLNIDINSLQLCEEFLSKRTIAYWEKITKQL